MSKTDKSTEKVSEMVTENTVTKEDIKKVVVQGEELLLSSLYERSMKEAERIKILVVLYMAAFILFSVIMISFAATLYTYPTHLFVWNDGSTIWGVIVFKLLVFIPLAFLMWFFGSEARKAKTLYELIMIRCFALKFAEEFLSAGNREEFVKEFLLTFAAKALKDRGIIIS